MSPASLAADNIIVIAFQNIQAGIFKTLTSLICILCYKFVKLVRIHLVLIEKITPQKKKKIDCADFVLSKTSDFPCCNLISIRIEWILSSKVESNLEWNFAQYFSLSSCISSYHQISILFQREKKLYENPDNLEYDISLQ